MGGTGGHRRCSCVSQSKLLLRKKKKSAVTIDDNIGTKAAALCCYAKQPTLYLGLLGRGSGYNWNNNKVLNGLCADPLLRVDWEAALVDWSSQVSLASECHGGEC